MKIKEGVILHGLKLEMRTVLINAEKLWKAFGQELVVTAGLDGTHSAGSLHYYGFALDFRTRYFSDKEKRNIKMLLSQKLSIDYQVISHPTHIHVEYQPKDKELWN